MAERAAQLLSLILPLLTSLRRERGKTRRAEIGHSGPLENKERKRQKKRKINGQGEKKHSAEVSCRIFFLFALISKYMQGLLVHFDLCHCLLRGMLSQERQTFGLENKEKALNFYTFNSELPCLTVQARNE